MVLYGYINEDGYLRTVEVEEKSTTKQNEKGEFYNEIVTVDQQIEELQSNGLKSVDVIDSEKLKSKDEYKSIRLEPFDNIDRISYRYVEYFDKKLVADKITTLKQQLEASDYKIIKSYEATLLNLDLPYDLQELYAQRDKLRKNINILENMID